MRTCKQFNKSRATPDFSNIVPISTNIGIAVRIRFSMTPPKIRDGQSRKLNEGKLISGYADEAKCKANTTQNPGNWKSGE
jgi:hypothetical protein